MNDEAIRLTGTVVDVCPGATFRVKISDERTVLAYLGGRLRKAKIRIILGDVVDMEFSPYDLSKGRIVYRVK